MKYTANASRPNPSDTLDTVELDPSLIAGYILLRSPTDKFKFNCYAVDKEDELLFCAASDLDFEKASAWVEAINKEFYPVVPSPTELVTIQVENEQRIFSAAK